MDSSEKRGRRARVSAIRSVNAGSYLESFLVSAIAAVLGIRVFLELTGYPQIGGSGLHIAHMLWGGFFMLAAIIPLLALLGQEVRGVAAILGGIGFGTFIDELGKFITADNDYFFRPAIALIYVIFILLFLLFRSIERRQEPSQDELLANSADMVVTLLVGGASREETTQALELLDRSGVHSPLSRALRQAVLAAAHGVEESSPSLPTRVSTLLRRGYGHLIRWQWFQRTVLALFVVYAILFLSTAIWLLVRMGPASLLIENGRSVVALGFPLSAVISSLLVVSGATRLPTSRLAAYRWFKRAILVSIFFGQFFLFYDNQLGAIGGLAANLVLLSGLNYMIREEEYSQRVGRGPTQERPA